IEVVRSKAAFVPGLPAWNVGPGRSSRRPSTAIAGCSSVATENDSLHQNVFWVSVPSGAPGNPRHVSPSTSSAVHSLAEPYHAWLFGAGVAGERAAGRNAGCGFVAGETAGGRGQAAGGAY